MHVLVTCKYKKDPIKNNREKVETSFFPLLVNGGFLLPWKPEFWSNLPQNLMQPFPHSSDATHKIWSRLAIWLQRYTGLKVWTTTTTDDGRRRTDDGPLLYYKLTMWAFGSGELKNPTNAHGGEIVTVLSNGQLAILKMAAIRPYLLTDQNFSGRHI